MINIVMPVKDRPRLTRQSVNTLVSNTDSEWNLTIIDDGSGPETEDMLIYIARWLPKNVALLRNETSKGILGQVKNLGVYWSEKYFGRGDWLCVVDNDIAFRPGWAGQMIKALGRSDFRQPIELLGGIRHPYHGINRLWGDDGYIEETDAVAGYMHFMRWPIWDRFGPLDAHAPGVCQSEDFAFCRKIVAAGYRVGYVNPPVIAHCGLTRTDGKPAIGAEAIQRVEGLVME